MITESCNLIGRKYIPVYNLKMYVLNWGKTLLFHSKSINLSKLFFIWPYPSDQPKTNMASLGKLGCGWPLLATPNQQYHLQSFPSLVTIFIQKSKTLTDSLQRYWWSNNPAPWLHGRFSLVYWSNSMYHVKKKRLLFRN